MLTFALDYDDTFTADPALWAQFIRLATERGHQVIIVTARRDTDENRESLDSDLLYTWGLDISVIYTNLKSKIDTVRRRGIRVNIWIDDDIERAVLGH